LHDLPVLRLDDREDHRPRPRPAGSHRKDAADARNDRDRRNQDDDSAAPAHSCRSRFSGGQAQHVIHESVSEPSRQRPSRSSRLTELPRLYAIVDVSAAERAGWRAADLARAYLEGGSRLIQIRSKALAGQAFYTLASTIVSVARDYDARVIVNDRADIARLVNADGVHLGQEDLPPRAARALLGDEALIGLSTHTLAQVEDTIREPADYVAVGPVFATASKVTGYEAVGLLMVQAAARLVGPVVAIGGITLETAPSVIAAGAASVAVIGDLLATGDPTARVREYMSRLERI
jgi:thiamine-phosphate pyrophosphorylase